MPTRPHLPARTIVVKTYEELDRFLHAFASGHLNLLILLGDPGLAKSVRVRQIVGADACWIEGSATAFGIYCRLWKHKDQPVVIDDVDSLYTDRATVRLLKCLCQTEQAKTLAWHSDARRLDHERIPRDFSTTSRVVIIANDWRTLNVNVAALQDRGHVILFEPDALEVHRQAASWFWDQEVFDFFADHLHWIAEPSLRHYLAAAELKEAGLEWRRLVLARCLRGNLLLVAQLKADLRYTNEEERVRAFVAARGGCRATYFNNAKKLRPTADVPKIILAHSSPPANHSGPLDGIVPLANRRFGQLGNG